MKSYTGVARNHPNDRVIIMTAKFTGVCAKDCGHKLAPGDEIEYDKSSKKAAHLVCPSRMK